MNHMTCRAFSLLELLCCIALLALLTALAIPELAAWVERSRHEALRNELVAFLKSARAYSIEHNHEVRLCGSSQGQSCDDAWERGWLLRHKDADGSPLLFNLLTSGHRLYWSGSKQIRFQAGGLTPVSNGTFTLCNEKEEVAWRVILNRQGRVRSETGQAVPPANQTVCVGK
ncbi:GspH/FimT family protein [Azomonas macrocytogenes]|uniref:Type II secretion system protein H n=1 Tax=Azomonas macrocytogenes TaxID=69962 RepID=A0A839SXM6_AZOMA|nr:GspH/FimT family pseudopilin [Azomonas macrocytogenes]MBB3102107.1 type IV fimbrial biogenesis protein FimT [Azomonas macrocytogenes]